MGDSSFTTLCGMLRMGHARSYSQGHLLDVSETSCAPVSIVKSRSKREFVRTSSEVCGSGKRVVVAVDNSEAARVALLWALSHVVHKLDVVTLVHVLDPTPPMPPLLSQLEGMEDISFESTASSIPNKARLRIKAKGFELMTSLKKLCMMRRPEVEVEALLVEGEKGPTIVGQAKKLEASIVVMGQKKQGLFQRFLKWNKDRLIEFCIRNCKCLALAVRRKSQRAGGYLIQSKWQKNFWLLA